MACRPPTWPRCLTEPVATVRQGVKVRAMGDLRTDGGVDRPRAGLRYGPLFRRTGAVLRRNALLLLVVAPLMTWIPRQAASFFRPTGFSDTQAIALDAAVSLGLMAISGLRAGFVTAIVLADHQGVPVPSAMAASLRARWVTLIAIAVLAELPDKLVGYALLPFAHVSHAPSASRFHLMMRLLYAVTLFRIIWPIILRACFATANAVALDQSVGFWRALGRAVALTRGSRLKVLGLALGWTVVSALTALPLAIWVQNRRLLHNVTPTIGERLWGGVDSVVVCVWLALATTLYLSLRGDDVPAETLSAFD